MVVWCKKEQGPARVSTNRNPTIRDFQPNPSPLPLPSLEQQQTSEHERHLMEKPLLQRLAPPGVSTLVAFLAYSSQWLFHYIEPGPLSKGQAYVFNALVACIFICYWRTCLTDPGRIPKDWPQSLREAGPNAQQAVSNASTNSNRWCRRCEAFKPPRAHHCKTCRRCVMKMDHHCIWTVCLAFSWRTATKDR